MREVASSAVRPAAFLLTANHDLKIGLATSEISPVTDNM